MKAISEKFKPCVIRNDSGKMHHVYLSDEDAYVEKRNMDLDVYVSEKTGKIVGVKIFDESLG